MFDCDYETTIKALFTLMGQANWADADGPCEVGGKRDWQRPADARQRDGYYGALLYAIELIAGGRIVEHWTHTGEIDLSLASRHDAYIRC